MALRLHDDEIVSKGPRFLSPFGLPVGGLSMRNKEMVCGACGDVSPEGSECDAWWPLMGVYAVADVPAGAELVRFRVYFRHLRSI